MIKVDKPPSGVGKGHPMLCQSEGGNPPSDQRPDRDSRLLYLGWKYFQISILYDRSIMGTLTYGSYAGRCPPALHRRRRPHARHSRSPNPCISHTPHQQGGKQMETFVAVPVFRLLPSHAIGQTGNTTVIPNASHWTTDQGVDQPSSLWDPGSVSRGCMLVCVFLQDGGK